MAEARQQVAAATESLRRMQAERTKFLRGFRAFLERQLGDVEQEEAHVRESLATAEEPEG